MRHAKYKKHNNNNKNTVVRVLKLCSLVGKNQCFIGKCCRHRQDRNLNFKDTCIGKGGPDHD
jgi:hypothetical protein